MKAHIYTPTWDVGVDVSAVSVQDMNAVIARILAALKPYFPDVTCNGDIKMIGQKEQVIVTFTAKHPNLASDIISKIEAYPELAQK